MKQRKLGDYVVNAELTDEQRERFVQDCVAAGCSNDWSDEHVMYPLLRINTCDPEIISGDDWEWVNQDPLANNVTAEYQKDYKESPMTQADLMRQIADSMERNPDGWWRDFERQAIISKTWIETGSKEDAFESLASGNIRPKPRTYTLHIEDMPEPMRETPRKDVQYWVIATARDEPITTHWDGTRLEKDWLDAGLCYPDKESAQQAMDKLNQAMGANND